MAIVLMTTVVQTGPLFRALSPNLLSACNIYRKASSHAP